MEPEVIKVFRINENIKVVLDEIGVRISINNRRFRHCVFIPVDLKMKEIIPLRDLPSVDELVTDIDDILDKPPITINIESFKQIPKEDLFWAQCSTLQVWSENSYSSNLLPNQIAFPFLEKLAEIGDPIAKRVFTEEILKRMESNHAATIHYLIEMNYLKYLNKDDLERQLAKLSEILDLEKTKDYKLDKKIRIFENLWKRLKSEKIRRFYKEELRKPFEEGNLKDVNHILGGIYDSRITILDHKDIDEIFENFNYNNVINSNFNQIERILNYLKLIGYKGSGIYKNIILKKFEDKKRSGYLIKFLIRENALNILNQEELQTIDVKRLSFDEEDVSNIPAEIIYLKSLEEIGFSLCDLKSIPEFLFNLPLKKLEIYNCEFDELPDNFDKFLTLEELSLEHNDMVTLPKSIKNMKSLKILKISENDFEIFPELICEINGLEVLEMNNCKIQELPKSFQDLKTLKELDISWNPISPFLEAISSLKSLISLNIRHVKEEHKIPKIPSSLKNLTNLKELDISANYLGYFPLWITELSGLEVLKISHNKIKELPSELDNLVNLKHLSVGSNLIDDLPNTIVGLKKIESIWMSFNRLKIFPELIGELTSLTELALGHNHLTYIPDSIGYLINLKSLHLDGNSLPRIPATIGNLTSLETLHLEKNNLKKLPLTLKNLKKLHSLYLKENLFTKHPSSYYQIDEIFKIIEFEDIKERSDNFNDLKYIEEVIRSDDKEKITELFISRRFDVIGKSEVRRLFNNSEIDPIECLILANNNIDLGHFRDGINFSEQFYSYIIERLPQLLLKKIETLAKKDIKILVWLELDSHLTVDQILSLTDSAIEKYLEAYFETRWDFLDGDHFHLKKFQKKFGKALSKHFKQLIEKRIVINNEDEIRSIYFDGWLELIKKKDLHDLLENDSLHFLDRLVTSQKGYEYRGFTVELDQLIFSHILSSIPPVEIRAIVELQDVLKKQFIYVVDIYYDEEFPGIKIQDNHVIALKLSGCTLKSLPNSIGYLEHLEDFDLSDNELEELPETIGNLKNLKNLNLGYNKLIRIPNSIGKLKNLKDLWIGDNNIMELPEAIWSLKKIKSIDSDFFDTPGLEATALTKIYKLKYIESQKEGNENITLNDAFKLYLAKHELSELGDQLNDLLKFKIRMDIKYMKVHDAYMEPALSKFGGDPDVPKNFKWPYWNGEPLDFLMQINLSDIKHFDFTQIPYNEGLLYVFYHTIQHKFNNINDKGSWRIIYTNEKDLIRMNNPLKSTEEVFKSGGIAFFKDISLPTPWTKAIEDSISDWKERDSYESLYNELFNLNFHKTSHWMFGYPHELAGPGMELKVELASNNIDLKKFNEVGKNNIDRLKEENWILLLMLSSDYRPGWNWTKGGRLYFWINKDDLKQGKFENVWMIAESQQKPFEKGNYPKIDFKSVKQLKEECLQIPLDDISLTTFQIRTFLNELAGENGCQYNGLKWECGGKDFEFSRKILNFMNIPKDEQEKFLEKCKEYGGYCDCEILMNAAPQLLGEDTPW